MTAAPRAETQSPIQDRQASAVQGTGEHITAQLIRAKQVLERRRLVMARRSVVKGS